MSPRCTAPLDNRVRTSGQASIELVAAAPALVLLLVAALQAGLLAMTILVAQHALDEGVSGVEISRLAAPGPWWHRVRIEQTSGRLRVIASVPSILPGPVRIPDVIRERPI